MAKAKISLTERDLTVLEFLWRWKVLSTAALTVRFFGERAPETAYTRLWQLKRAGFLVFLSTGQPNGFVWSITQKGFHAIRHRLPELEEEGFKAENVGHDALVSAIHLGEWLKKISDGGELISEQELRRFHPDCLQAWCPKTKSHRPDGYWHLVRKEQRLTIALEVEINQKKSSFYSWLAKFYDERPEITRVVWVVQPRTLASSIWHELKKTVGHRAAIHNFVNAEDFKSQGWEAPILIGPEEGKSLNFLLNPEESQSSPNSDWTRFLLDTRKCPHKSKTYQERKASGLGNCIGAYPY